jgi:hypothetical protein
MHIDPKLHIKHPLRGIVVGDWCKYKCFGVDTMKVALSIQILIPNVYLKNHKIVVEVNWFLKVKPKRRENVISMIFHGLEDGPNIKTFLNHLTHS